MKYHDRIKIQKNKKGGSSL